MAVVIHPYIMGAPHRLRYFREALEHIRPRSGVVFWTGEANRLRNGVSENLNVSNGRSRKRPDLQRLPRHDSGRRRTPHCSRNPC
ncbi:MAG TPA: hypothetical protein VGU22_11150 [Methylomirabilota bacterium]|jgi:hypothetical protein|nr:hypothetical protein [Methylomirabilota bacterium]